MEIKKATIKKYSDDDELWFQIQNKINLYEELLEEE